MEFLVENGGIGMDFCGCFFGKNECNCNQLEVCNCNYKTCACNKGNEGAVCPEHCWGDLSFPIDPWSLENYNG